MGTAETQLVIALLLPLIKRLIQGGKDTTALERKMAEAKDIDALREIIIEAAAEEIGAVDDSGVIKDIIKADNTEEVVEVVTQPGVVNGILAAIGGLFGLIFKKRKD